MTIKQLADKQTKEFIKRNVSLFSGHLERQNCYGTGVYDGILIGIQ